MRYIHLRPNNPGYNVKGGLSIGYRCVGDTIQYSIAKCHREDVFCKKTAREIISSRIEDDKQREKMSIQTIRGFLKSNSYKYFSGISKKAAYDIIDSLSIEDIKFNVVLDIINSL
jgi:hypothetical protein